MNRILRGLGLLTLLLALGLPACFREYDFTHRPAPEETLGVELHKIWIKDAARSADRPELRVTLLERERDAFVSAVDTIAPPQALPGINIFLQSALSLAEDGTLPGLTRKVSALISELTTDDAFLDALTNATAPSPADFVSPVASPNFVGYMTAYPRMRDLGLRASNILLENDGFLDTGGLDNAEPNGVAELLRTATWLLDNVDPADLEDSIAFLVRDMLLRQDDRFGAPDATREIFVAVYDDRGYPQATDSALATFFTDVDGDGLADLDVGGRFVRMNADNIALKAFNEGDVAGGLARDAFGRASIDNQYLFRYVDLNKTGLAFLLREFADLSSRNVTSDLLTGFRIVMGDRVPLEDEQGPYLGFNADHPLLDLTYALVHTLSLDSLPELMDQSAAFLDRGSSGLAAVVVALNKVVELADAHPDASLNPTQTILPDLIPVLHDLSSDPALWADVMRSLGDPVTQRTGEAMETLLSYKNTKAVVAIDGAYDACFQGCNARLTSGTEARFDCIRACPNGEIFKTPMDFSAPESPENRSMLQATFHLMWGMAEVPYEMKTTEVRINGSTQPALPPLMRFDSGAVTFLRAVAGNLDLAEHVPESLFSGNEIGPILRAFNINANNIAGLVSLLSELFGVQLSERPTPDQLTRLFNQPDIIFRSEDGQTVLDLAEPQDADGFKIADSLADSLYEAEASGLLDAVKPVAKAFSDHDREDLLLDLFTVVHMHYAGQKGIYKAANGSDSPTQAGNLRAFEPVMKDIFADGTLLRSLAVLSGRLNALEQSQNLTMTEELRKLVFHLTRPDNFQMRSGETLLTLNDGRTIQNLSRMHVLVDALDGISERLASEPEAQGLLGDALGNVFDVVLASQWPDGGDPAFVKQGSVALTVSTTEFLAERARERRDAGTLSTWMTQDVYEAAIDFWQSRLLAGLVQIGEDVLGQPENREVLEDFTKYLLDAPRGREHTAMLVYELLVRSINVETWVPVAKSLAKILDPDRRWPELEGDAANRERLGLLSHGALALRGTLELDTEGAGLQMIHRGLVRRGTAAKVPWEVVFGVVADFWRVQPDSTAPFAKRDWTDFMTNLKAWLEDESHGMEQLYDLVELRQ